MKQLCAKIRESSDENFNPDLPESFRLRAYDPKLGIMLRAYEPTDASLLEEGITSYFLFKVDPAPFEEVDNEAIYIKMISWQATASQQENQEED